MRHDPFRWGQWSMGSVMLETMPKTMPETVPNCCLRLAPTSLRYGCTASLP